MQFGARFRVTVGESPAGLLEQVGSLPPVAALLTDHRSGRALLDASPSALPDAEWLLVARSAELSQAQASVERGEAKRYSRSRGLLARWAQRWRTRCASSSSARWCARCGRAWTGRSASRRWAG